MLTQYGVQTQLDVIANEVSQMPGLYYELYSRLFSQRVHQWMQTVSPAHAELINRVASEDPDYFPDFELADTELLAPLYARSAMQFNPAWDMDY